MLTTFKEFQPLFFRILISPVGISHTYENVTMWAIFLSFWSPSMTLVAQTSVCSGAVQLLMVPHHDPKISASATTNKTLSALTLVLPSSVVEVTVHRTDITRAAESEMRIFIVLKTWTLNPINNLES